MRNFVDMLSNLFKLSGIRNHVFVPPDSGITNERYRILINRNNLEEVEHILRRIGALNNPASASWLDDNQPVFTLRGFKLTESVINAKLYIPPDGTRFNFALTVTRK